MDPRPFGAREVGLALFGRGETAGHTVRLREGLNMYGENIALQQTCADVAFGTELSPESPPLDSSRICR